LKKILHSTMKENNYLLILRTIFHEGTIERVSLVKKTLLSPSTVTRCITDLNNAGYILEIGPAEQEGNGKLGRKAISLKINPRSFQVLVVDIGAVRTNYAIGNADGTLEKLESSSTPDTFEEILEEVNDILQNYKDVEVVAFSVPGMVDVENDTILFVPSKGWKNIKINVEGKVVYADNEANLAMIAEAFQREEVRKSKCSVFVTVREGFGTGLWINGELFRGPSFSAGEFGHTILNMQSSNLCRCGNYGCLETYTSISRVFGKGLKDAQSHLNKLFRKKAAEFLEYIETLSVALTNIVNAINPEYLILGGELSGLDVEFYELLEKKIKGRALENSGKILKVLPPTFTHDTYLYGALYAVIEEYFIPNVISKVAR